MKIESNKNWTTCLRLNTGDGSPRVFLLNSHFLGSVPTSKYSLFSSVYIRTTTIHSTNLSVNKNTAPFGLYNSSNGN